MKEENISINFTLAKGEKKCSGKSWDHGGPKHLLSLLNRLGQPWSHLFLLHISCWQGNLMQALPMGEVGYKKNCSHPQGLGKATPTLVFVHKEGTGFADGSPQHAGDLAPHWIVSVTWSPLAEPDWVGRLAGNMMESDGCLITKL